METDEYLESADIFIGDRKTNWEEQLKKTKFWLPYFDYVCTLLGYGESPTLRPGIGGCNDFFTQGVSPDYTGIFFVCVTFENFKQ